MKTILACLIIVICAPFAAMAQTNNIAQTMDAAQSERFNKLALEIRCVVCQSEPVATSQAKIAIDMRDVIKARILAGDNDKQVRQYFADHYGEYVLLRPQVNSATLLLWGMPIFLLLAGGLVLIAFFRTARKPAEKLDEDEIAAALAALKTLEK